MLRSERDAGTALGIEAGQIMSRGDLVPDHIMIDVAKNRLSDAEVKASGFVLDGFPRTTDQAEALVAHLADDPLDAVIDLNVPLDEVKTRMMARGREDDTEAAISQRLDLYERQTRPVLDWFNGQGLLVTVDGLGTEDEVAARLTAVVDNLVGPES